MTSSRFQLLSSLRDEGPFILEWIAHHKVVGFSDILIAYNDCTDGSDILLEALTQRGEIRSYHNQRAYKGTPQGSAYKAFFKEGLLLTDIPTVLLDLDEFLNIHIGKNQIQDLIAAWPDDAQFLSLNWKQFGASGRNRWQAGFVTEQFTRAFGREWEGVVGMGSKWLVPALSPFKAFSNHVVIPKRFENPICYCDGSGQIHEKSFPDLKAYKEYFRGGIVKYGAFDWVQINHYGTRSFDDYLLRVMRGRGVAQDNADHRHNLQRFLDTQANAQTEELSISRYHSAMKAEYARLMQIDEIAQIQNRIQRVFQKRIQWVYEQMAQGYNETTDYIGKSPPYHYGNIDNSNFYKF